jgi:hypothetical protein
MRSGKGVENSNARHPYFGLQIYYSAEGMTLTQDGAHQIYRLELSKQMAFRVGATVRTLCPQPLTVLGWHHGTEAN